MTIRYVEGNILDDDAECLVNPVNCVGVMGAGLARQFKERFPDNFRIYRDGCRSGDVRVGHVFGVCLSIRGHGSIANLPTKDHWRDPSRIEWVRLGVDDLARYVRRNGIRSVAIPQLGCGLGGLDWADVRPLIEAAFADVPWVDVRVYGPAAGGSPA